MDTACAFHLRMRLYSCCLRSTKAGFPLGEFVRANREKSNLIGWRQTLTSSPANHIRFLLVRANKFTKWKTGLIRGFGGAVVRASVFQFSLQTHDTYVERVSQRSNKSHWFSPDTLVSSHREC